jgi:hypothetical protein
MRVIGQGLRDAGAILPRGVPLDLEMQGWTSTASGVASRASPLEAGCIGLTPPQTSSPICRLRQEQVFGAGDVLVGKGKQDTVTCAIERRPGRSVGG